MTRTIVRLAALALFLTAMPMAAQSGAWSAVGSSGNIDEMSLGAFAVNNSNLGLTPGFVGSVVARYNVTNTYGGGITDAPPWSTLQMTYFDNAAGSNVAATLFRVNACTGAIAVVCSILNSVDNAANTCQTCVIPAGAINFATSLYYVEVKVSRNAAALNPQLIGLRIF